MHLIFVIGTAGSGKSLLVSSYGDWLTERKQRMARVNLDPGAANLPYAPDVDVRDYVTIDRIMEEYKLSPNGALIVAADRITEEISRIRSEIESLAVDYVLIDTPGQLELFAFRASGPYIVREMRGDAKAAVYLFDATFSVEPLNYVSNLFLATAVYTRFLLPQVYALSKSDLLPQGKIEEILRWSEEEEELRVAIYRRLSGETMVLSRDILEAVSELGLTFELIPVSAKTWDGIANLHAQLTRIFLGGEEAVV